MPDTYTTDYLQVIFDPTQFLDTIKLAAKSIKAWNKKQPLGFEAIAFTGVSGAALAFPLAAKLNVPLLCVRKPKESTHSFYPVEGYLAAERYIIVDDFIDYGDTINFIVRAISEQSTATFAKCIGIYQYASCGGYSDVAPLIKPNYML